MQLVLNQTCETQLRGRLVNDRVFKGDAYAYVGVEKCTSHHATKRVNFGWRNFLFAEIDGHARGWQEPRRRCMYSDVLFAENYQPGILARLVVHFPFDDLANGQALSPIFGREPNFRRPQECKPGHVGSRSAVILPRTPRLPAYSRTKNLPRKDEPIGLFGGRLKSEGGSVLPFSFLIALPFCMGTMFAASGHDEDERVIRNMVDQSISRLNKGDVTAFEDFWDEQADYAGVDGRLTIGRSGIQALFRQMVKSGTGQQTVTVEQIRFITPELAAVDGSWVVTGAHDAAGKELPAIHGRGFELVQKKNGGWRFIVTREMVVFSGK